MKYLTYRVEMKSETDIFVGREIIKNSLTEIKRRLPSPLPEMAFVVFDETLPSILKDEVISEISSIVKQVDFEKIVAGEELKTIDGLKEVLKILKHANIKRNDLFAVVGGGSLTDVCGLAAAIYMRGIKSIFFPTTILSMVDASIGGKNGVNFLGVKNLIGSFYNPNAIIIDTRFIDKLPPEELLSGFGEVAKTALLEGKELYELVSSYGMKIFDNEETLEKMISLSAAFKASVVSDDPFEKTGYRRILNFGHTLGHAIEAANIGKITHGEAVLRGMLLEERLALENSLVDEEAYSAVKKVVQFSGIAEENLDLDQVKLNEFLLKDKKRSEEGILRIIYIKEPGFPAEMEVPVESAIKALVD